MINIDVATKTRGFLSELFNYKNELINFNLTTNINHYETNTRNKQVISNLIRHPLGDYLGIIQRIENINSNSDVLFSYNRFLKTDRNYVIYLENPLALVHYSLERPFNKISKIKINNYLNDKNLKAIICLSKACYDTLNVFYEIPDHITVTQIYPLVSSEKNYGVKEIDKKVNAENIKCLYVSSNFSLKGGNDILSAFEKLNATRKFKISLTIVTELAQLDTEIYRKLAELDYIEVHDFTLSKEELKKIYKESSILLNPTRQDSFSLVVLESMKFGNAIISTDLYAIPEMVEDSYNGYLVPPKYRFFDYNNLPNKEVWNNRKKTIYSNYIDEKIVSFLIDKLSKLENDRTELKRLCQNSLKKSQNEDFSEHHLIKKWYKVMSKGEI